MVRDDKGEEEDELEDVSQDEKDEEGSEGSSADDEDGIVGSRHACARRRSIRGFVLGKGLKRLGKGKGKTVRQMKRKEPLSKDQFASGSGGLFA